MQDGATLKKAAAAALNQGAPDAAERLADMVVGLASSRP